MSRWDKHRIVVDLDRFTVCTQLNIILDRDLAANRPDPVRILDVGNMTSHSHHTDRANSTGGAYGLASKITKQDVRGCLSPAVLPRDCHNITCTLY